MNGDIRNEGPQRDIRSHTAASEKSKIDQKVSTLTESFLDKPTPQPQKKYTFSIWTKVSDLILNVWNRFFGKAQVKPAHSPSIDPALFHKYDSTPQALQFYELTRRIPKEKMNELNNQLAGLENREADIREFFKEVLEGKIDKIPFGPNLPIYALYAVKKGIISVETFSTLLNFNVAKTKYHDLEAIPLFLEDGSRNPRAVKLLEIGSIYYFSTPSRQRPGKLMKEEHIDAFFDKMKGKNRIAQTFFIGAPNKVLNEKTMSEALRDRTGLELFNYFEGKKVIPSFEMMQTAIDAAYGKQGTQINPVLGLSSLEDISTNNIVKTRDMALIFPGLELPKTADGFRTYGFDFTYHDFYHALITSNMTQGMQQLMNLFAEMLKHYKPSSPEEKKIAEVFREALVDMEVFEFKQNQPKKDLSQLFWDVFLRKWRFASPHDEYPEILQYLFVQINQLSREIDWEKETGVALDVNNDLNAVLFWSNLEEKFQHYLGFIFPKG